jgi:HD-GYP domain-containing protein (c-di-GMP phosphodiesterase class II)
LHPSPGPDERRQYQEHVLKGELVVRGSGFSKVVQAIRHHHERWDGEGYPDRISGDAIPLLARLVHVAEVFDVLTSSNSYRHPVTVPRALEKMHESAGRQFDPEMVNVLQKVVT